VILTPLDSRLDEPSRRRRYPGTLSFTDSADDQARFFGRKEEIEQLYLRVLSVPLLVQFGKSGLGKTSLLQAGLFPRLRRKPYLPVMVRLNIASDGLTAAVVQSMTKSCEAEGLRFSPADTGGLWELLTNTIVWRNDLLLTPVLVFDPFEEVFTGRDPAFRAELAAELGALASGIAPARLGASPSAARPRVKIVISLREDYLGSLEEFSAAIPGLFHERLRLEPLGEDAARKGITQPAQLNAAAGEEPYWSPRFVFERAALDAMVADQKGKSGVEPFQLQLVCRYAEAVARQKARAGEEEVTLTLADLGGVRGFKSVRQNFYRDTLRKVTPNSQRKRAAVLCEEGLLGAGGHRLSLEEGQILRDRDLRVTVDTLDVLCQERLVVRERRLESVFYEISHDRLAESIYDARRTKMPRRIKRLLWAAAVAAAVVIALLALMNFRVKKERDNARIARDEAAGMLSFLLGEEFLGEVRDDGRSSLLERVRDKAKGIAKPTPLNRGLELRNEGDIERIHGRLDKAIPLFQEALRLIEHSGGLEAMRETARTRDRLGEAFGDQGRIRPALDQYVGAAAEWRSIVSTPAATTDDCTSFGSSLVSLAVFKKRMGEPDLAAKDLDEAVRVTSNLLFGPATPKEPCGTVTANAAPYPDATALDVLAQAAVTQSLLNDDTEAAEGAAALAAETRKLRPPSVSIRRNALIALSIRGNFRLEKSPQAALEDYRGGVAEFEELQRWDPSNRLWLRDRAAFFLLEVGGTIRCYTGETRNCAEPLTLLNAEAMVLEATATLRAIADADATNASLKGDLASALQTHAAILALQKRRHPERLAKLKAAEEILHKLQIDDLDADAQRDRAMLFFDELQAYEDLDQRDDAERAVGKSIDDFKKLVAAHPGYAGYRSDLAGLLRRRAALLEKRRDRHDAAIDSGEAVRLEKASNEISGQETSKVNRIEDLEADQRNRGYKSEKSDDYNSSQREFTAAAAAMREYLRLRPANYGAYHNLHRDYDQILAARKKLNDQSDMTAMLRASMHAAQIAAWLAPEGEQREMNNQLMEARYAFADFLRSQGTHDANAKALALTQEMVVVAERLVQGSKPQSEDVRRLGSATCLVGNLRRNLGVEGWEETIRSGLIHIETATRSSSGIERFAAFRDLGVWRKYYAEQLDEAGRKPQASEEFRRARDALLAAQKLIPENEDVRDAVQSLGQRGH
jgi:tetratricopeptide (TPR) repeat protein